MKRARERPARILYARRPEFDTADEKLTFLEQRKDETTHFEDIEPDTKHNWIDLAKNDFEDTALPVASKETKATTCRRTSGLFLRYSHWV